MSTTYIAGMVMLIIFIAKLFNVNLQEQGLTELLTEVIGIGSAIWVLYKRVKQGDISVLGMRKKVA